MTQCQWSHLLPRINGMNSLYRMTATVFLATCYLVCALSGNAHPQFSGALSHDGPGLDLESMASNDRETSPLKFPLKPALESTEQGVDWRHLFEQSLAFLSVEHAFRCATEEGTRQAFS